MKKYNNLWRLIALVCVMACLCLCFAACNKDNGGDTEGTTQSTTVGNSTYTVKVRTISGVELKNVSVYVYTNSTMDELETMKQLDETGSMSFEALTSDKYVAVLMGVPKGYNVQEYYAISAGENEIVLTPAVITDEEKPEDKVYALGDVMYDFSITASDGTEYTLSQVLEEKDAVVLNFWYLNCNPCKLEFPYLEMAYAEYSDRIEVLAINCEDGNDAELNAFGQDYELTFPLAIGDKDYWYPAAYMACPTTIVVDRYGTIVYMHTGYFDEVAPFNALFRMVTGEEYEQVFIEDIEEYITEDDYRRDGTEERPFELGGATEFDVKVPANGLVYYNLYRLLNVTMRIENPNAYVIVDGQTYYPTNGVIELQVSCEDTFKPVTVAFGNTSGSKNTIHVQFVFEPGNVNNPIELVLGNNEVVVNDVNGLGTYYTYTATTSGTLTLTVQSCTEQATPEISLYNTATEEDLRLSSHGVVDPETGLRTISIQVNEGDCVQIIFSASTAPEITLPSVTILALASLKEGEGSGIIDGKTGYSVTVVDQDGNPVPNARVTLSSAEENATLTTDENGCISIRLTESAYFLELTVPAGYMADVVSYMWSPALKDLVIQVFTSAVYTVQIQTEFGLPMENVLVQVYADEACENLMYAIATDSSGFVTFIGKANSEYYLTLTDVDPAFEIQEAYTTAGIGTVITLSKVQADLGYALGDVMEDFSVTDIDGMSISLQNLLQEKEMVILVFWRIGSAESTRSLVTLQQMYVRYGDKMAVLALNPVDKQNMELQIYQSLYDLSYPLAMCDKELAEVMGVGSFPTMVVIDREGRVAMVHSGEITAEQGAAIAEFYTAEDYSHMSFETIEALMEYIQNPPSPDEPENPDNPEQPENPDDPEQPVTPEE